MLEPPPLDDYFDYVLRHQEDELTAEQVALEARFLRHVDQVRINNADDPAVALEEAIARLQG